MRAGRILSKGTLTRRDPQEEVATTALLSSVLATTHEVRKLCQLEGIHLVGDLTDCDTDGHRRWREWTREQTVFQALLESCCCPTGPLTLAVGQVWQKANANWLPSLQQGLLEVTHISDTGSITYRLWWIEDKEARGVDIGQTVRCRSDTVYSSQYDDLFQQTASYRRLSLALPYRYNKGKAQYIGRKVL